MVQWSRRLPELQALDISLVLVSVGTPAKGGALVKHLDLVNGEHYVYVDPENRLYDAMLLNRGIDRTFFNVNTPYAFLERVKQKDGLKDLGGVLAKWSKGA
jgi:AhpC/TSA antioxidant enzyme